MSIVPPALGPLLGNTVNTVISPFYTLFSTNATYCFTARTNVRNHKTETETLKGNLLRIKQRITDGETNGLIRTEEANDWVQRAEQAISEEAANRESFDQRWRIFGCSLNCWGNYKTSKKAAENVHSVRTYISSTPVPENVTRTPPPPRVVDLSTHSAQLPPSREHTLENALRCIKDDDAVRAIGIWGPDRDGKTHLLKKINDSFLEDCDFDFVIFVTASSELSVQAQIVSRLRTDPFPDVATQATRISELLKKKSFLLLVDDLRVQLDLQAVGIPYPLPDEEVEEVEEVVDAVQVSRRVQSIVVVTSISQSICHLMHVQRDIHVPDLEDPEARQLFAKEYGQQDPYSDPGIGALAEQLVIELKGLPSDLIRYGKMMQGIRDEKQWKDAIDAVRKANLQRDDPLNLAAKIVRNLDNATKDLDAKGNDVRREIVDVERQQRTPTNVVSRWLQKVDNIIRDAQVICHDCRQLKKDVTMEASEKLREVQECLSSCPSTVAIESMPPPVQEMPGPSMSAKNRNLQEALHFIKDEPTVGMIGIWGPGGVGKTHLLKNINNSFGEGMDFNFALFVTTSKECSVEKVQSQIIERLKLPSTGSKHLTIYEYMKTKSFLVLLDDLWDEINLEDVGIPYPLGNVNKLNRKVVLTTRLRKVCGQMKVKKELKVAYLQEHEAWQLFKENIGAETLSSPHIEALARKLVKELKGLPLALVTIGKAMYQKDEYQWETAIQYMKQSCCTDDKDPVELGMETNVFKKLKFSYDNLRDDTLRACFLTCVLWPEDAQISKVNLAQCWMGLGLVNGPDIESSFRKSYSLIADLTAACLLDGCEYDDIPFLLQRSDGCVKVHDVIRDMALWISRDCGENNDKWIVAAPGDRDQKVIILSNKAECISLTSCRIPIRFNFDPLKLRILCLRNNEFDESIIVEAIKNCSSLTYLDLSGNKLKRIPEELCSLVKLEYLDLSENEFGKTEVPQSFGKLINLKFLYLKSISGLRIPAGVISRLKALQVIDLRSSIIKSTGSLPKWIFRELGTLPQLKALDITVQGSAEFESLLEEATNLPVRYLRLQDVGVDLTGILSTDFAQRTLYELDIIRDYITRGITVIYDTEQPNNHFGALNRLRLCYMRSLREINWMGATPAFIFPRLTCLDLFICERLSHLSWVMYLPRLEQLHIGSCDGMAQAFIRCLGDKLCNGQDKTKTFPCLKILNLNGNESLETIGDKGVEFPSLERLVLSGCPKLKRLPFQLDSLPLKLKELHFDDAQCWERLECEQGVKTFLQPALKFGW